MIVLIYKNNLVFLDSKRKNVKFAEYNVNKNDQ